MQPQNKRLLFLLGLVILLMLIPFIAMQFTNEVNWSLMDFVVMGLLLTGMAVLIEMTLRIVKTTPKRVILVVAILSLFLLIWVELAVGIFRSPFVGI
ncbi:MAG: hypothetical protein KDC79_12290 [Cyclobacteriaceae bacterium]|nr:hypothetical protein [Cyclobacteriaceae bacterium]